MGCSSFPCTERRLSGEPCRASFPRAFNLRRHIETQHQKQSITFVDCNPDRKRKRTIHTRQEPLLPSAPDRRSDSPPDVSAGPARSTGPSTGSSSFAPTSTSVDDRSMASPMPSMSRESGSTTSRSLATASPHVVYSYAGSDDADPAEDIRPEERVTSGPILAEREVSMVIPDSQPSSPSASPAHLQDRNLEDLDLPEGILKPIFRTSGRTLNAALRKPVPEYEVKMSKSPQLQGQQRGVHWLTSEAKKVFEERYAAILSGWGVKPDYEDTCIVVPAEWSRAKPRDLYTHLNQQELPTAESPRAFYSYSDHTTSFARAKAWFSKWPRRGVELDNFLECGPFSPMDASHRCHQKHCIIHLVLERAHTNVDRCDCQILAKFLRREGRKVPEHCDKHNPPCLLQHAALTVRESFGIQFDVLSAAQGLPPQPPTERPRGWNFPTFEGRLPTRFSAIKLKREILVAEPLQRKNSARPHLACPFCEQIRSFASIKGFWTHIFRIHEDIESSTRLDEMHRAAGLWRVYWKEHSAGGKTNNATQLKLVEMEKEGFGWDAVIAWNLH